MILITLIVLVSLVVYAYIIYPILLGVAAVFARKELCYRSHSSPSVTLIIPAYNESSVISQKLENSLAIAYPSEQFEIIVASDGSDDGTNEIVNAFVSRGIVFYPYHPRSGKISVLNRTIPKARGEIVVLCDANVMFRADAIERMVAYFSDPSIGAVTGDVRIQSEDAPFGEGEGLYYRYERFIQLKESLLGSTVTVDGGMYAIRKHLFRTLPADTILDDFVIGMNVALAGYRVIYAPSIIASENATIDVRQEFSRKVRIVAGAFRELLRGNGIPSPRKLQLFWSYVSHKFLRWLIPWFMLTIFLCSLILVWRDGITYWIATLLFPQIIFYACALIGSTRPNARWPAMIGIPFYFCMVNAAAWLGSLRGLLGVEKVTWRKAVR